MDQPSEIAPRGRRPAAFRQADVVRALRAARAVDESLGLVIEPSGRLVIGRFPVSTVAHAPEHEFARGLGIVP
jgi:hypothetical protein